MAFPSTFVDLQNAVLAKTRMDPNATADVAKVKDWINQVYAEVVIETEANITSATMDLTAGTNSYTLPAAVSRIKALFDTTAGVQFTPLIAVSLDRILRMRVSAGGTGVATGPVEYYALLGATELELYPTPSGSHTLTVYYVALPTALSADTDLPTLEGPYGARVLEFGALAEAADFKGDPGESEYRQLFEYWMGKYRAHLLRKKGGQPGQFEFADGRAYPPHDPSTILPFNA